MSGITNWCSQGNLEIIVAGKKVLIPGHPFDADDENSEIVSRAKKFRDEKGNIYSKAVELHICGHCMRANDPYHEYEEEDKIKKLEAWNEGFEEGKKAAESPGPILPNAV